MNKFRYIINIITIILANNSWSYSDNSAVSFANSWQKNRQVNVSDIRAIRSLSEKEKNGETEDVGKFDENDDEGYDKDRYNALTQDYFDMMEEDLNNNKEFTPRITEIINNIDPRAQLNYYMGKVKCSDIRRASSKYRKRLWRKIKRTLRAIDRTTEREMYYILKSKYYARSNAFVGGRNMAQKLKNFLYKYKVFTPVLLFALLSYVSSTYFSAPGLPAFFALTSFFTFIYLAYKYVQCSRRLRRFPEHISQRSINNFRQRLKREIDNEENETRHSRLSMDDSTDDIKMF
ncbi:Plasmodium exported protein, unknown function [Plasmodium knowlesi strain H]|uniref:Pv-fam-d protein n=3 Tax=Plasmodium knowlesi TaxID=5850 RepID=A0A5E7X746_PLAKH|nr:Plasmodium exported protein, unknown function [Plasmodium knowlesi strain H]OTN63927.1 Uncharacterized protein PKNOH_S140218700 [Plasmodium knowlesi]CAA9990615.1 Plasmodium exported protein, unknown function [Plasmodium knowlesi strain H]SBO26051.1 Plasmodium exported protein, unknown function [Plasmodium knowlesi strain H]SBO28743.1 Plasmodium exported protein, unknown function [Plasmodium knowlesi strain H]VVS80089.1 Plasmodium exported protein, unknown function [Plasmodium knowlesi strai